MVARRGFLAGAAALAVSGCGRAATDDEPGGAPRSREATSVKGDVELLQTAVAMEAGDATVYEVLGNRRLRGETAEVVRRFVAIEDEHVKRLGRAVQELGGNGETGWTAEEPGDDDDPVELAIAMEGRAIAFYLDMLPKVHDAKLRTLVASILAVEAEQLAVLRRLAGQDPASGAFVYGAQS